MTFLKATHSPTWIIVLVLISVGYIWPFPYYERINNPNENARVYTTRAIVEHGTFAIDEILAEWGYVNDKAAYDGKAYAGKAPGVSVIAVPFYAAFRWSCQALDHEMTKREIIMVCRLSSSVIPLLVFLWFFAGFTRRITDDSQLRMLALVALALGSTVLIYAMIFASHSLIAACIFGGVMASHKHRDDPENWKWPALAGFLWAVAIASEYPAALGVAIAGLYGVYLSPKKLRYFGMTVVGGALPMIGLLWFHTACFGGPLETPYDHLTDYAASHEEGFYGMERVQGEALFGTYLSPSNGLFWFMPWTIVAVLMLIPGLFVRELRESAVVTLLQLVIFTIFVSTVDNWRGGWTAGPRYIVPVVPFLAWYLLHVLDWLRSSVLRPYLHVLVLGFVMISVWNCCLAAWVFPHFPEQIFNPIYEFAWFFISHGFLPHVALGIPDETTPLLLAPLAVVLVVTPTLSIFTSGDLEFEERLLVFVSALCIAFLGAVEQSRIEDSESEEIDRARQSITDMWQPPRNETTAALQSGQLPDRVEPDSTADEIHGVALDAAIQGFDQTAIDLFRAARDARVHEFVEAPGEIRAGDEEETDVPVVEGSGEADGSGESEGSGDTDEGSGAPAEGSGGTAPL